MAALTDCLASLSATPAVILKVGGVGSLTFTLHHRMDVAGAQVWGR